jgi:hypothetical protein
MEIISVLLLVSTIVIAVLAVLLFRARLERDEYAMQFDPTRGVHIFASRDVSRRDRAPRPGHILGKAVASRPFSYERARDPRFRSDLDSDLADLLKPVQVIRVSSASEREDLEGSIPPHIRVVFVEEEPPPRSAVTVPLPRREHLAGKRNS